MKTLTPHDLRTALIAASKLAGQGDEGLESALSVLNLLDQLVDADDVISQTELLIHKATFLCWYGQYEEALKNATHAWKIVRQNELVSHGVQVNQIRKGIEAAMADDGTLRADDATVVVPAPRNRRLT